MNGSRSSRLSVPGLCRLGLRWGSTFKRYRKPQPELAGYREGHGEQIWIFNHLATNQIVYSHSPILRNNRSLRQLPFNGKQTKPAKLRKDYWKPLALIQFAQGSGVVGRSVFQKLREFRRRHELSWGYQAKDLYAMDRPTRGVALSDQRANTIADMAAVLAGSGAGNRIRLDTGAEAVTETGAEAGAEGQSAETKLDQATIFWANEHDREIASSWPANVIHVAGIPQLSAQPRAQGEAA